MIAQAVFDQRAEDRLSQTTLQDVPRLVAQAKKMPPDDVQLIVSPEGVLNQWGALNDKKITTEIREKFREKLRADIMMEQLFPDSKTTRLWVELGRRKVEERRWEKCLRCNLPVPLPLDVQVMPRWRRLLPAVQAHLGNPGQGRHPAGHVWGRWSVQQRRMFLDHRFGIRKMTDYEERRLFGNSADYALVSGSPNHLALYDEWPSASRVPMIADFSRKSPALLIQVQEACEKAQYRLRVFRQTLVAAIRERKKTLQGGYEVMMDKEEVVLGARRIFAVNSPDETFYLEWRTRTPAGKRVPKFFDRLCPKMICRGMCGDSECQYAHNPDMFRVQERGVVRKRTENREHVLLSKPGIHDIRQDKLTEYKVPGEWFRQYETGLELNKMGIEEKSHVVTRWGILGKMVMDDSPLFEIYIRYDNRLSGVHEIHRRSAICNDNYERFKRRLDERYSSLENYRKFDYIPMGQGFQYNDTRLGLKSVQMRAREQQRPVARLRERSVMNRCPSPRSLKWRSPSTKLGAGRSICYLDRQAWRRKRRARGKLTCFEEQKYIILMQKSSFCWDWTSASLYLGRTSLPRCIRRLDQRKKWKGITVSMTLLLGPTCSIPPMNGS